VRRRVLLAGVMIPLLFQGLAIAGGQVSWQRDGVVICSGTIYSEQGRPVMVVMTPDGKGGAIIAWADTRDPHESIYAQRIDSSGTTLWAKNGVRLRSNTWRPYGLHMVSDGREGAIAILVDYYGPDFPRQITAQRVDSSGTDCWGRQGMTVTSNWDAFWYDPKIVTDGKGGAIVAWKGLIIDWEANTSYVEFAAQRVDSSGVTRWGYNGALIDSLSHSQYFPTMASDGLEGAILSWVNQNTDHIVTRIDGNNGQILWNSPLMASSIVSDGKGGGIVTWSDGDIFAQRLSEDGEVLWTPNGVPICVETGSQGGCKGVSDGADGGVIAWVDFRDNRQDFYAQRINGNGETLWDSNGVYIATAVESSNTNNTVVTDGRGGVIITWRDYRAGNWDIYCQRINSKGQVRWDSGGLAVCTDPVKQSNVVMAPDGNSGAIIAWFDDRGGGSIYAQRVADTDTDYVDPYLDGDNLPTRFALEQNYPNPFNENTVIRYSLLVDQSAVSLKIYNILGQEVRSLVNSIQRRGEYKVIWDGKDDTGVELVSGVY